MNIGDRIRQARINKGMTQEELGRAIGSNKALINKYEKGVISNLPLSRVEQLAIVLGVTTSYLTGWDGTKNDPTGDTTDEVDTELSEMLEELKENSDMRMLFHSAKNATPTQIKAVAEMLRNLRGEQ